MTEPTGRAADCAHCGRKLTEIKRDDQPGRTSWIHTDPADAWTDGFHTAYPAANSIH